MPVVRFESSESAFAEIQRTRQAGKFQTAIGLARLAIKQFPAMAADLHFLIADIYVQAGQGTLARQEKIMAEKFVTTVKKVAQQRGISARGEGTPSFVPAPDRDRISPPPRAADLLAALLPASGPWAGPPLPVVPAQQREELLEQIGPLMVQLVQMEAALADRTDIPEDIQESIRQSRQELRTGQSRLQHVLAARLTEEESPVAFTSNLGPVGQTYFPHCLSQGPEVLALQKILKRQGLSPSLSGFYDAPTQRAVYALQTRYGLQRIGVVDAATRELLQRLAAEEGAPARVNHRGT